MFVEVFNDALNFGSGFQRRKQQCKNALESRVPGFEVTSCNLYHMQINFHPLGAPGKSFFSPDLFPAIYMQMDVCSCLSGKEVGCMLL